MSDTVRSEVQQTSAAVVVEALRALGIDASVEYPRADLPAHASASDVARRIARVVRRG